MWAAAVWCNSDITYKHSLPSEESHHIQTKVRTQTYLNYFQSDTFWPHHEPTLQNPHSISGEAIFMTITHNVFTATALCNMLYRNNNRAWQKRVRKV